MMSRFRVALALIAWVSLSFACFALPDLIVSDIQIAPDPIQNGDLVQIEATIKNIGDDPVPSTAPFFVRFFINGREFDVQSVLGGLASGRSKTLVSEWPAIVGTHALTVEIDGQLSRVDESNEDNNTVAHQLIVFLNKETAEVLGTVKIAVASFVDQSGSGFLRLGEGIADDLAARLSGSGLRVVNREELENELRAQGLNPLSEQDLARAANLLDADVLVVGSVPLLDVTETTFQIGFVSIDGAAVDATVAARVLDTTNAGVLASVVESEHAEGATGFSFDLGGLFSALAEEDSGLCDGGFRSARSWYNVGETATFAYKNPGADNWFSVEINTNLGSFVTWIGWQHIAAGACGLWYWDQMNSTGLQLAPGLYVAKLWDGTSYVATVNFQIRPGITLGTPPLSEITAGTPEFDESVVGEAVQQATADMTASLLDELTAVAPMLRDRQSAAAEEAPATLAGQVASLLPDGRIALNVGASAGVAVGDTFEVVEVSDVVTDPQTSQVLSYDPIRVKGTVVITEVRELVSYAVATSTFTPAVGDIARLVE